MLKALSGKIIIKSIPEDNQTSSGLVVVNKKARPHRGVVVSAGASFRKGKKCWAPPCKEGDLIYFKRYKDERINSRLKDTTILSLWFEDIIAVIRNGQESVSAVYDDIIAEIVHEDISDTIYIPDTIKKQHAAFYARVHSVGPAYKYGVVPGDRIAFPRHEGIYFDYKAKEYCRLQERWVQAVVDDTVLNMGDLTL